MKRIIILSFAFFLFSLAIFAQSSIQILHKALLDGVEAKVTALQEQIKFTDEQTALIKDIEISYLIDVQKIDKCFLCNKKKKMEKLVRHREEQLQKIMTPGQYIRYIGGSIDDVKRYPVRVD